MASDWSVPATDVLDEAWDLLTADEEAVLVTVLDVEGSAYRRPGAKMLVTPEGGVGAITAGCLEDEVQRVAESVLAAGERRVETYDLMEDDEGDVWGLGVGCNGVIDVLLEPLDDSFAPAVEAHRGGDPVAMLTVVEGDGAGSRGYYRPSAGVSDLPGWLADAVEGPAADLLDARSADTVSAAAVGREATVFVDAVAAPPDLVVLGSGLDVGPVVELGKRNGFRTTVVAFRGAADLAERFPAADRVVTTSPAQLQDAHEFDESTYAVVMTHNFVDDRLAVEQLLDTETPYVGLMGPRERFSEMLEEFEAEGRTFEEAELAPLYTPIGLDLGGGSPHQIATSIVSEVLAVHNDREPRHLSGREGPIHERVDVETAGGANSGGDAEREAADEDPGARPSSGAED
jgi:xanthine dehydrogenase accessory factor